MARMEFPEGPVTETHAPQFAELFQLESDNAVPKISEGSVQVENEQAPPATFPPQKVACPDRLAAFANVKRAAETIVDEKCILKMGRTDRMKVKTGRRLMLLELT